MILQADLSAEVPRLLDEEIEVAPLSARRPRRAEPMEQRPWEPALNRS